MNLNQDMSLFTLITGASLPVLVVMALLLITSMVSWWYIFIKVFTIRRADRDAVSFENAFWIGGDLNLLYEGVTAGRKKVQGSSARAAWRIATSSKARAAPCVPLITAKWTSSMRICRSWLRSVR